MRSTRVWRPELLTKIEIVNAFLTVFHVGEFKNLELLDLSNNKITNIRGCGLEHCDRLKVLNLKNNLIIKKENLKALWYVSKFGDDS